MRAGRAAALLLTLSLGLITGCSGQTERRPSSSGDSHSSSSGLPEGVPHVTEPLDVAPFEKRPCVLVEKDAIASIGDLGNGTPDVNSPDAKRLVGPSCNWSSDKSVLSISVVIGTVHRDYGSGGIKGVYAGKEQGLIEYIDEVTVPGHPGYPAAFSGVTDERAEGEYSLKVGVTDNLLITVSATNWDSPKKARPSALKVAASVLDTLKEGS